MVAQKALVTAALRRGSLVHDALFDRVYPLHVQRVSRQFWTPVDVAIAASRWLAEIGCLAPLDVGAGAGKFCIVASLSMGRAVTGLEHRADLVDVARSAAAAYGAQVECVHGSLESIDAAQFDALYFFNPFAENLFDASDRLDDAVELSEARCFRDLATVERWLDTAPRGTCIVTYHGFGGRIPATYEIARTSRMGSDHLRLWVKRQSGPATGFFLEVDERILSSADLRVLADSLQQSEPRERVRALLERPLG
jgi:predicted RNA methylase